LNPGALDEGFEALQERQRNTPPKSLAETSIIGERYSAAIDVRFSILSIMQIMDRIYN
jgi:hypothetical protein